VRSLGGLLRRAAAQPRPDLHAERRRLLPARRAADVLLARLRLVSRALARGAAAAPVARVVGRGRRHAWPRHAEQIRRGAPRGRRWAPRADPPRPAPLVGSPWALPRPRDRPAPLLAGARVELPTRVDLLRVSEHARTQRLHGDTAGLDA